jgi:DNA end-binding protein Ku
VESGDIVKGYDLGGGEYVILTDEELESAEPEKSRNIEITDFVDLDEIDPVYYRTTYYLAPQGEAATKAYALLRQAMREANKVGIATWVHRNKEYLVAIRPEDDVVALETMFFADEVRRASEELPALPGPVKLTERELSTAQLLIDSMAAGWEPGRYHDTHRQKVEAIIDQKRQGQEIVTEAPAPRSTKVVDLMEALQASVAARRSPDGATGGAKTAPKKTTTKRAPAKAAAKKAPAKKAPAKTSTPKRRAS